MPLKLCNRCGIKMTSKLGLNSHSLLYLHTFKFTPSVTPDLAPSRTAFFKQKAVLYTSFFILHMYIHIAIPYLQKPFEDKTKI